MEGENKKIEYVQVLPPDKMMLAELVSGCKGPDRTMAQFADECNVGASTLSRIVNCKITKPVSEDMLRSIYEQRAETYAGLTFDRLVRANGMRSKEEQDRMVERGRAFVQRQLMMDRERAMQNTIVSNLVMRNIELQRVSQRMVDCPENSPQYLSRRSDITIYVRQTELFHNFFFFTRQIEGTEGTRSDLGFHMRRLMEWVSGLFLIDAWQPECLKNEINYFVFIDRRLFEEFCETLKISHLNSIMVAMLIDTVAGTIMDESRLGQYHGEYHSVFESEPVMDIPSDDEDDPSPNAEEDTE